MAETTGGSPDPDVQTGTDRSVPERSVEQLRVAIEHRRSEAERDLTELEKRGGELLDLRRQAAERPALAIAVVAVPVALIGLTIALVIRGRRNRGGVVTDEVRAALESLREAGFLISAVPEEDEKGGSRILRLLMRGAGAAATGLGPFVARQILSAYSQRAEPAEDDDEEPVF